MKILITGATGFLGKNFLEYINDESLIKKNDILLLSSREIDGYNCVLHKGYTYESEEILKKTDRIDVLVHMGAFSPKTKDDMYDIEANTKNITNTLYLLNNLGYIPKKIVYISTINVYDLNTTEPISENSKLLPNDIYGYSKLYCEEIVKSYCKKNNSDFNILRLGVVYGNQNFAYNGLIPTLLKSIINNKNLKTFNGGNEKKSFINVKDCCRAISKSILNDDIKNDISNVVSNENHSIKEIINMLIEISKKSDIIIDNIETDADLKDSIFDNSHLVKVYGNNKISLYNGLEMAYKNFEKEFGKIC